MNIQRFLLPATVAAAFHAAMFYAFPEPIKIPHFILTKPEPPAPQKPPESVELVDPPKAEETDVVKEVKPIPAGAERPELPDTILDHSRTDLTIPFENRPMKLIPDSEKIGPLGTTDGIGPYQWNTPHQPVVIYTLLDKPPRATVRMPPDYPSTMKKDGVEGIVTIEFDVDVKGRVVRARVRESTQRAFEEPTLRAVLKWRFEPGLSQGRPVPFRMVIPVNFKLGES